MRYYKHLYLTEGLERKKRKSSASLESGELQPECACDHAWQSVKRINWKSIRHSSLSSLHFRNRICSW